MSAELGEEARETLEGILVEEWLEASATHD